MKGSRCFRLSCDHIFCRSCLEDFWKLCIEEGDIDRVGCADLDCVKVGRGAKEEEVARVVPEKEVERWRWLREKRDIERGKLYLTAWFPGHYASQVYQILLSFIVRWNIAKHLFPSHPMWRMEPGGSGSASVRAVAFHSVRSAGGHGKQMSQTLILAWSGAVAEEGL